MNKKSFVKKSAWQRKASARVAPRQGLPPRRTSCPKCAHYTKERIFIERVIHTEMSVNNLWTVERLFRHSWDCKLWMRFPLRVAEQCQCVCRGSVGSLFMRLWSAEHHRFMAPRDHLWKSRKVQPKEFARSGENESTSRSRQVCNCLRSFDICTLQKQQSRWRSKISQFFFEFCCEEGCMRGISREFRPKGDFDRFW